MSKCFIRARGRARGTWTVRGASDRTDRDRCCRREGCCPVVHSIVVRRRRRRDRSRARLPIVKACRSAWCTGSIRRSRSSTVDPGGSEYGRCPSPSVLERELMSSATRVRERDAARGCARRVEQRLAHGRADAADVRSGKLSVLRRRRMYSRPNVTVTVERGSTRGGEPDEAREPVERDVGAHVVLDRVRERLEVPQHAQRVDLVGERAQEAALARHARVVVRLLARPHVCERLPSRRSGTCGRDRRRSSASARPTPPASPSRASAP